ncbi:MOSC domain-containing protein [Roseateles sp. DC23W]|uniref:MOSC domain-containing protein n=1 Tax=Pelomonas dachongensis TaxID=3299029 RepID=A0ABW7EUB7_9BURK
MADLVSRVAALWRYPVKSCAGEAVDALQLDAGGWPAGDRSWAIADAGGDITWMGAHPRLALVQARLDGQNLMLQAGQRRLTLAADAGSPAPLKAWNAALQDFDHFDGWDAGDDAAALLRSTTGEPLRLVRLATATQRRVGANPLHLVGDGSLRAWRDALPQPLDDLALRVRPNLLLQAVDSSELPAFIEDILVEMRVGPMVLKRTAPCVRCLMTTVDPRSAEPQPEALQALTRLSSERAPGAPVQFGVYLAGGQPGRVQVGDLVDLSLDFDSC